MLLADQRWEQVEEYLKVEDRVLLPIGSTEQHGTRGIFGTDALIPEALCEKLGEKENVLVAPSLNYGMAEHHMAFPGTVTLSASALMMVVSDILSSFARHGLNRILIVNGHGGNDAPVHSALSEICSEIPELKVQYRNWYKMPGVVKLAEELFGDKEGHHGTPSEVSVTMFLRKHVKFPENVKTSDWSEWKTYPSAEAARRITPTGLYGSDPNLATAEYGKRFFDTALGELQTFLNDWGD